MDFLQIVYISKDVIDWSNKWNKFLTLTIMMTLAGNWTVTIVLNILSFCYCFTVRYFPRDSFFNLKRCVHIVINIFRHLFGSRTSYFSSLAKISETMVAYKTGSAFTISILWSMCHSFWFIILNISSAFYILPCLVYSCVRQIFTIVTLLKDRIRNGLILIPLITCWKFVRMSHCFMNRLPQILLSINSWWS